jgi:hypothetical protein
MLLFKYDCAVRIGNQIKTYKDKSGEFKFICTERINDNKVINNIFIYQTKFAHLFTQQPSLNHHLFFMVEINATEIDNSILAFEIEDFFDTNQTIHRKISGSFVTCNIDIVDEAKDVEVAFFCLI